MSEQIKDEKARTTAQLRVLRLIYGKLGDAARKKVAVDAAETFGVSVATTEKMLEGSIAVCIEDDGTWTVDPR